jgi:serine phosphatase RsbU (regulator of sigma subunit)
MGAAVPIKRGKERKWQSLVELGDQLITAKKIYRQVEIIQNHFEMMEGCQVEISLLEDFKPLPHTTNRRTDVSPEGLHFFTKSQLEEITFSPLEGQANSISVPLKTESGFIGMIQLEFASKITFSNDDLVFFVEAGRYIGKIIDLVRLSHLKEWRIEQLSLVRQVSNEIIQLLNEEELFPSVVKLIQETFKFYCVVLYTADLNMRKIHFRSSAGKELSQSELLELTHSTGIDFGEGLIGICAEEAKQILSADVSRDDRYRNVPGLEDTKSELCLPLVVGHEVLGVLEILSEKPNRFHENDILVLKILADNVALVIQNAGLFDNMLEQTWASTLMLQVSEAAQRFENVDDLLKAVVRVATIFTGVQKCAIYLWDKRTSNYILNAHYGFNQEESVGLAMLPFMPEVLTAFRLASSKETPEGLEINREQKSFDKDQFFVLIPINAHGDEIGILLVDDNDKKICNDNANTSRGEALMAVGQQTALAVENFYIKESQENEAYINTILLQVAEMVVTSIDLDETIESIVSLLPLVVGVDTVFVYILEESRKKMFLNARLSSQLKSQLNRLPKSIKFSVHNKLGQILSSRNPCFFDPQDVLIEDWIHEVVIKCKTISDLQAQSEPLLIAIPLFALDKEYGLLFTLESEIGIEYREKKIEIIDGIAKHISLAIQNEQLKKEMIDRERIQRELQLAQDIQRTFLPEKLPDVSGWNTVSRWQPAKQVGGDFYDAFRIDDERLGVVIADVSDKGMPAALYMTVARTLIHAEGKSGSDPASTLKRVNEIMIQNSREGLFVTCFYAVIQLESGEMVYANAGHNQPLWHSLQERKLNWLKKGGMPLGVDNNLQINNESIWMNPGDLVLLYTDGVVEAQKADGELFGEKRLFSAINFLKGKPIQEIIENLESRILEFRGNAQPSDDLTLLAVERSN